MRIYFAGAENGSMLRNLVDAGAINLLMSYYYLKEAGVRDLKDWLVSEEIDYTKLKIYLDCGAFTAWTKGIKIDLQQYMDFVKLNQEMIFAYSSLDDKDSVENTKNNLKIMEENGLKPVAVYHLTMNDWNYFKELCSTHDYVAIGAISGEHQDMSVVERNIRTAIDIAKEYKTKLHIYGLTVYRILAKYPIYSADSTDWLMGGKQGSIIILNNARHTIQGVSYHDKIIFRHKPELEAMGLDYNKIVDDKGWKERDKANIKAFLEMNKNLNLLYEETGLRYWDKEEDDIIYQSSQETLLKTDLNEKEIGQTPVEPSNEVPLSPNKRKFEDTKGKIKEILTQNPEIEKKRKERQREWAKTGLAHFKNGKYAVLPTLFPEKDYGKTRLGEEYDPKKYYNEIIESIKGFDVSKPDKVLMMLNEMIKADIVRAAKNLVYESADGGLQDKNLSTLINNISSRLLAIMALRKPEININNIIVQTAEEITNTFDESTKQQLIVALRRSLEQNEQRE